MLATKMKAYNKKLIEQGEKKVVLNMYKHGHTVEEIAELSGLSVNKIKKFIQ